MKLSADAIRIDAWVQYFTPIFNPNNCPAKHAQLVESAKEIINGGSK